VVAGELDNGLIAFIDFDRGISGITHKPVGLFMWPVMDAYDRGEYTCGLEFNASPRKELEAMFRKNWPQGTKYTDNPHQFYKDMMEASEYIMSFNLMNFDSPKQQEAWSSLVYALGCKFSEEGTTREQDVVLKTAAEATKDLV